MPSMKDGSNYPISDEELQKITVGERKPHNALITLVEYDSRWPELFDREAERVRSALAKRDLAKRVWRHVQHYADAKTSIVQEIMNRANAAD